MINQIKKHPIISIVLLALYAMGVWMAYTIFGGLGLAYILIVPLPIIIFSIMVQKNKGKDTSSQMPSIWATPIPYLGIVLIGSVLIFIGSKLF
jgi:uncharacterized oligopeptide transporter (OPT) family protein